MSDSDELIETFSNELGRHEDTLMEIINYTILVRPDLISQQQSNVLRSLLKRLFQSELECLHEDPEFYAELYRDEFFSV